MRQLLLASWLLCSGLLLGAQAPNQDLVSVAGTVVDRLARGEYAAVVDLFDDKMRALLPEDKLREGWAAIQAQTGVYQRRGEARITDNGGFRVALIEAEFARAKADIQLAFTANGRLAGFAVRPPAPSTAFTDASYVVPANFTERELTVDVGGWPLPATLALPTGPGPFPAVVLVYGSGPGDRDATVGGNKVFRDLGRGLASRGVATLRYEKRTREHGSKIAVLTTFTVKEETIDDAVAAARLLSVTAGIDPQRVYVAGHSLGGMLAPRIAIAGGPTVRGLIILAGAVRSLEQSILDQSRYLAAVDGISADEQKRLDELNALVLKVRTLKATDPPVTGPSFSAPASYFVDLRGYDPPALAQTLKMPMLVLQGERDYQVTVDDFAKWRAALGARADVTLKSYPALNHLFIAGTGPSLPTEYAAPGHVAEEVIADIATWVRK